MYDYSAGYGGRLLGITSSNMRYNYVGIDPNTETAPTFSNYLQQIIQQATGGEVTTAQQEYTSQDLASQVTFINLEKYTDEPNTVYGPT